MGVCGCVSVRGASAKNGNAKFLAENSQSTEHARYHSAEEGAASSPCRRGWGNEGVGGR